MDNYTVVNMMALVWLTAHIRCFVHNQNYIKFS